MESCRLCNPYRILGIPHDNVKALLQRFKPAVFGAASFEERDTAIDLLLVEQHAYRAAATGLAESKDLLSFWRARRELLPNWSALAFNVALFQPSSAGAERIFSQRLAHMYDHSQASTLQDSRTAAVMVRFNEKERRRLLALRGGGVAAGAAGAADADPDDELSLDESDF